MSSKGALDELFSQTFWFADVTFVIGMGLALNTESAKSFFTETANKIYTNFIISKKKVPQHIERGIKSYAPKVVYHAIRCLMIFTAVWTLLNNLFSDPRPFFINFLYLFYPLCTAEGSAHDILLNDDRSIWSKDVKRRHVLIPVNLEGSKVFPTDLTATRIKDQLNTVHKGLRDHAIKATLATALSAGLYYILPPVIFVLACPGIIYAQNEFNFVLDALYDIFALRVFKNRFDHLFGNYFALVAGKETHENFGRQYQYFNYSFKPLEKVCNREFFKKARNKFKANVAEAKAAYYLGRGACVATALFVFNLINWDNFGNPDDVPQVFRIIGGFLPYLAYYGAHAAIAYRNQSRADWYDIPFKRALAMGGEMVLAGHLFYRPIMRVVLGEAS